MLKKKTINAREKKYLDKVKGSEERYRNLALRAQTKHKLAEEALKKANNKLREINELNEKIFDNVPASIITLNKAGEITSANSYWTKLTRIPLNKTLGTNFFSFEDANKNGLSQAFKKILETKRGKYVVHKNVYGSDIGKKTYYLDIKAAPLFDEEGKTNGLISIAYDVTTLVNAKNKLKKLNEILEKKVEERTRKIRKTNKKLEEAIDFKTQFIADASHEIRTPITIIKGNLDLMTRGNKDKIKNISEEIDIISKEVDRISGILTDLTTLAQADSGQVAMKRQKVRLDLLIKNVIKAIKGLVQERKIQLKLTRLQPIIFNGDKDKLEKIFFNLISNAIKYGKQKGWVKIALFRETNDIKIIVEDNGLGISKDDLPFIFERFYRADKSRARDIVAGIKGTGLGLAICKWAVEAHQGKIEVKSQMGKGSKFMVILPKKIATAENV